MTMLLQTSRDPSSNLKRRLNYHCIEESVSLPSTIFFPNLNETITNNLHLPLLE